MNRSEIEAVLTEVLDRVESRKSKKIDRTIEQALADWLTAHDIGRKPLTRIFHAQTMAVIRKHLRDLSRPVSDVTAAEVMAFAKEVERYCPSRWNVFVSVIRSITVHGELLKRRKLRFRDLTLPNVEDFQRFLAELDKLPRSDAGVMVRFLTLTGLRFGEAKKLRWENIGKDRVTIPAGIAKSGRARVVPFLGGTAEIVEKLQALRKNELVFPKPWTRRAIEKACQRTGIPLLSMHCFRHMFATRCIEAGCDLPTVSRWMGHSDGGALLARMYFHLSDAQGQKKAAKLNIL
jgi:integrase